MEPVHFTFIDTSSPPWTLEQVQGLNEYQSCSWVHPFTCPDHSYHPVTEGQENVLVATTDGWVCPHCDYRQLWAHDHMFLGAPQDLKRVLGY